MTFYYWSCLALIWLTSEVVCLSDDYEYLDFAKALIVAESHSRIFRTSTDMIAFFFLSFVIIANRGTLPLLYQGPNIWQKVQKNTVY